MSNIIIAPVNGTVLTIDPIPTGKGWIVTFRGDDGRLYTYTLDTVFVSMCQALIAGVPIGENTDNDGEATGNYIWNQYQDSQPTANAWIDGIFRSAMVGIGGHPEYPLDVFTNSEGVSARFAGRVKGNNAEEDDEFITLAQFNQFAASVVESGVFNVTNGLLTLVQTGDIPDVSINLDGRYTPMSRLITINQGSGIAVATSATQSLANDVAWTISHADTSSQTDISTTGVTVIGSLGFDTYGHVISASTRNITAADIGHFFYVANATTNQFQVGYNQSLRFVPSGSASVSFDAATRTVTIGFSSGAGDGNNFTSAMNWDASTGNLSLQRSGLTTLQTNLDGRYLTSIAHNHFVGNSAGVSQFGFGVNDMIRFAGSGVTFVPGSKTISLNYVTTETDPIANAKTISLLQGAGITITGVQGQTLGSNPFWSVAHADTSNVANINMVGATVLSAINFDDYGHVTGVGTRSLTPSDIGAENAGHVHWAYNNDYVGFSYGTGQGIRFSAGNYGSYIALDNASRTVFIYHNDTSSVQNVLNSGPNFISSLGFDDFGHVTSAITRAVTAEMIGAEPSGHFHRVYSADWTTAFVYGSNDGVRYSNGNSGIAVTPSAIDRSVYVYHADTSTQNSLGFAGNNFVSAIYLDDFGHVTYMASKSITASDIGAVSSISHEHIVEDANGVTQFVYNIGQGIRFFGINGASVGFDGNVRGVIFNALTFARADWGVTYARRGINLVSGNGISVTAVDAPADNETRFTISTTPCTTRRSIVVVFDKPSGIQVGDKFLLLVPTNMIIQRWFVTYPDGPYNAGNMSVSFDLKQSYYTNYPSLITSLVGSGVKPNITNAPGLSDYKNSSSLPSGWYTTELGENHYLIVECTASSGVATNCSVHLLCEPTCGALN